MSSRRSRRRPDSAFFAQGRLAEPSGRAAETRTTFGRGLVPLLLRLLDADLAAGLLMVEPPAVQRLEGGVVDVIDVEIDVDGGAGRPLTERRQTGGKNGVAYDHPVGERGIILEVTATDVTSTSAEKLLKEALAALGD